MKLLDAWQWLLQTRIAAAADVMMLPVALAWTVCLIFDADLLQTLAPLAALGTRMPQVWWAVFGAVVTAAEIAGLARRALGRSHRTMRLWATLGMGVFFAWLAGEVMARDPGVPGGWYFAWFAGVCLVGAGRLLSLRTVDEELSRL